MNVLHVIPSIDLSQGGPSRTAVSLANSLVESEKCKVFFYTYGSISKNQLPFSSNVNVFLPEKKRFFLSSVFGLDYFKIKLIIEKYDIDIVHIHGIWYPLAHWSARAAIYLNTPYIIQPRGMLEPWAIQFKRFKKRIAMYLYQRVDLERASGFIATAEQEAHAIRSLLLLQKVAVIPNGVAPVINNVSERGECSVKTALFMSRIHPKKGVYELVRAWARLRPDGWRLRIVGPDDGGHLKQIQNLVLRLELEGHVAVVGPLYGDDRETEYASADLFVLPTYSENFGVAVAEALTYGIPVLTTKGAPWSSLIDNECGWWIDPGEDSLVKALPEALSIDNAERREMGIRAKKLAANFDWTNVARQTLDFYSEVLSLSKQRSGIR